MSSIITKAELKEHKTKKSLWLHIHGKVYDVTEFLKDHPGGDDPLLENAGINASNAFDDVGHSSDAKAKMEQYLIGVFSEDGGTENKASMSGQSGAKEHTQPEKSLAPKEDQKGKNSADKKEDNRPPSGGCCSIM